MNDYGKFNDGTLTFGDVKKMDYSDSIPFNFVLIDLLLNRKIDVNYILSCYSNAIEQEKDLYISRFNESCVNILQLISDESKGDKEFIKRSLHTVGINRSFNSSYLREKHGYTDKDEKNYDELCEQIYGTNLKNS